MKLEGRIIVAQPIQSGVSKNGNNWQRQDFVLEIPGQYTKKVAFSVIVKKAKFKKTREK